VISIVSLVRTVNSDHQRVEAQKAEQADRVVTLVIAGGRGTRLMVRNYSPLPVYDVWVFGPGTSRALGALPPCRQFDVSGETDVNQWSTDLPVLGLQFTDSSGRQWHRYAAEPPESGPMPAPAVHRIRSSGKGSGFGTSGGPQAADRIPGGCA
jgi:hypothetical protein